MSEEFKAIIEMLQNAGAGTLWMFFGYLACRLISIALYFLGGIIAVKVFLGYFITLVHNENKNTIRELCRDLKIRGWEESLRDKDRETLINKVNGLKEYYNKN